MKNYILFSAPRSGSTHVCDILGNYLVSNNIINQNLYEYFNTNSWFFTYDTVTKKTVDFNSNNSYYVDYRFDQNKIIHETVITDRRDKPVQRKAWQEEEMYKRLDMLNISNDCGYSYLFKLFPMYLKSEIDLDLLKNNHVLALTRRNIIEQILSLYFVLINNNNFNIRNANLAMNYTKNSIFFDAKLHHDILLKNINRIRIFKETCDMLSIHIHYYEDIKDLSPVDILRSMDVTVDTKIINTSRYVKINNSGLNYYDIVENKNDVNHWFETYAKDLL